MSAPDDDLGFAPEDDAPIPYMQRIRDYYLALGYPTPYRWAHYAEGPFRAAREAALPVPRRVDHHRRTLPAGQGRPGPGCLLQCGSQILRGLFAEQRGGPRSADFPSR